MAAQDERHIGALPPAAAFDDDCMLAVEHQGQAERVSGAAIKSWVRGVAQSAVGGGSGSGGSGSGTMDHSELVNRTAAGSHPGRAISFANSGTGLTATNMQEAVEELDRRSGGAFQETDPTVPGWAKQPAKPGYSAEEIGFSDQTMAAQNVHDAILEAKRAAGAGGSGGGGGDMFAAVYDPRGIATDVYAYADQAAAAAAEAAGGGGTTVIQGVGKSLEGQTVEPEEGSTIVAGTGAEIFSDYRSRTFDGRPETGNVAGGDYSRAAGARTTATGFASTAEGELCVASGDRAHAEGNWTVASGASAHSEGVITEASGRFSHAENSHTIASGTASHAQGEYTIAAGRAQHVCGKYNVEDTADTYAFIIGNGTSQSQRSNALTLDWSGNLRVAGSITDGNGNVLGPGGSGGVTMAQVEAAIQAAINATWSASY